MAECSECKFELTPGQVLSKKFDADTIEAEKLDLARIDEPDKLAYCLRNVFTEKECSKLIELTEVRGYVIAAVNYGDKEVIVPDYRKGHRIIIDDKEFVEELWRRIEKFLPKKFGGHRLVEINERLRFLKYEKDGKFAPHSDAQYARPDGSAISFFTLQMYLNEGFEGGETTLLSYRKRERKLPVVPEKGMILAFDQDLLHEGSLVTSGVKYTLRTDVMYTHLNK